MVGKKVHTTKKKEKRKKKVEGSKGASTLGFLNGCQKYPSNSLETNFLVRQMKEKASKKRSKAVPLRNTIQSAADFPKLKRFQSTSRYFQLKPSRTHARLPRLFFEGDHGDGAGGAETEAWVSSGKHRVSRPQEPFAENRSDEIKCIGYFICPLRIGRTNVPWYISGT